MTNHQLLRLAALVLFIIAAILAFTTYGTHEQETGLAFVGLAALVASSW